MLAFVHAASGWYKNGCFLHQKAATYPNLSNFLTMDTSQATSPRSIRSDSTLSSLTTWSSTTSSSAYTTFSSETAQGYTTDSTEYTLWSSFDPAKDDTASDHDVAMASVEESTTSNPPSRNPIVARHRVKGDVYRFYFSEPGPEYEILNEEEANMVFPPWEPTADIWNIKPSKASNRSKKPKSKNSKR